MIACTEAFERAEGQLKKHFRQFGEVEKSAQIIKNFTKSPALFIFPLSMKPHGKPIDGGMRFYRAEEEFSAGIVLNASGKDKLQDLDRKVRNTFQGHMLPSCLRPIAWTGSRLLQAGDNKVIWQINFETLVKTGD